MKKTYTLSDPKMALARRVEAVKNEIRKYIKRERRKQLPAGADFWDFDCRFGQSADEAQGIHLAEIQKYIDKAEQQKLDSFYIEILAKPGIRTSKPRPENTDLADDS
ncbi:DUF6172 family protein [Rubellicoccus peritrichatus]|uniref:DUF6172 family protein n=1 Tax=Rubellicoccus peritrichatus TaxID=3080537 RepID=A0AAQ3QY84_9BACT|nr:DUF6172 family protein [Puniceicoccus sp. CR14]WOO43560.1 DUF6172 family protein [Puniceicoccus sp. CR14]